MDHPFEVGGRYQNRKGEYEVLAFEGEKMRVRYNDGSEQSLNIEKAAWIWQSILDESGPPLETHYPGQGSQSIQPVIDLVADVLTREFKAPYPEDITYRVFQAIEADQAWLAQYDNLILHYSSGGKDGKSILNQNIGYYTADLAGMVSAGQHRTVGEGLIGSYTILKYPDPSGS